MILVLNCFVVVVVVDTMMLEQLVDPTYIHIYKSKWNTIKDSIKRGVFKDVYHFIVYDLQDNLIRTQLDRIFSDMHGKAFKLNASFGLILQKRSTEELNLFHPSNNNTIFDSPKLVSNAADLILLLNDMERNDVCEYAKNQRPDTNWTFKKVICVRYDITKVL